VAFKKNALPFTGGRASEHSLENIIQEIAGPNTVDAGRDNAFA